MLREPRLLTLLLLLPEGRVVLDGLLQLGPLGRECSGGDPFFCRGGGCCGGGCLRITGLANLEGGGGLNISGPPTGESAVAAAFAPVSAAFPSILGEGRAELFFLGNVELLDAPALVESATCSAGSILRTGARGFCPFGSPPGRPPWSREFSDDSSCEWSSDDLGAQVRDSAKSCPCICTVTFPQKEKGKNRRAVTRSGPISATCVVRPGGRAANGGGEKDRASGRTAGPLGTAGPTVSRPGARQAQGACGEAPAGGRPHEGRQVPTW